MSTTYAANTAGCIDTCNELLRGELSAVETYRQTIDKFVDDGPHHVQVLKSICDEHSKTAGELRQNILEMGGTPSSDSGAWGTFAKGVQAAANLLGEDSAIESLIQGEKHGIRHYEEAIADEKTLPECRTRQRSQWMPRLEAHVTQLEALT